MAYPNTINRQLEILNAKLSRIYTYADGKTFDIREELEDLELLEKVYSVIEVKGSKEGSVFDEYSKHLNATRDRITFLQEKKNEIEGRNSSDIMNINLLIESLYDHR